MLENTVGKGEIAGSHGVFKRLVLQTRKNQDVFGKELNQHYCLYRRPLQQ